jgi:hypothetical protein
VVQKCLRRARSIRDLEEDTTGRGLAAQTSQPVQELANALIAGPRQAKPLRFGAQPAVDLGEAEPRIVQPVERSKQAGRDPGREREHDPSVREKA